MAMQRLKPGLFLRIISARLKACPDTERTSIDLSGFFRIQELLKRNQTVCDGGHPVEVSVYANLFLLAAVRHEARPSFCSMLPT